MCSKCFLLPISLCIILIFILCVPVLHQYQHYLMHTHTLIQTCSGNKLGNKSQWTMSHFKSRNLEYTVYATMVIITWSITPGNHPSSTRQVHAIVKSDYIKMRYFTFYWSYRFQLLKRGKLDTCIDDLFSSNDDTNDLLTKY